MAGNTLFGNQGQPLFQGLLGASPFNTGTAPGSPLDERGPFGFVNRIRNNARLPFVPPTLAKIPQTTLSLLARRRLAGAQGVGSTFLTGNGGVRPGSQTLGYSTLLGS